MIIKNVPDFIHSFEDSNYFVFDKNEGRFIYICRNNIEERCPVFIVYDLMFNSYIKLKADPLTQNLDNIDEFSTRICCFLPVNVEMMLVVLQELDETLPVQILLLKFDHNRKIYLIVDQILFPNCSQPEILSDENGRFLLFCVQTCKDEGVGETDSYEEELELFITQAFTVESDKICLQERKEIDYNFYGIPRPWHLHFWNNKLWFLRDSKFPRFVPHTASKNVETDPDFHLQISYLNLTEEKPKETVVRNVDDEDYLLGLQWSGNYLIFQSELTKFCVFDLTTFEMSHIKHIITFGDPKKNVDENKEWTRFRMFVTKYNEFTLSTQFFCDKNLTLTAVNNKTHGLHRFSLRSPPKFLEIAWFNALNNGFIDKISSSNAKLLYSHIF